MNKKTFLIIFSIFLAYLLLIINLSFFNTIYLDKTFDLNQESIYIYSYDKFVNLTESTSHFRYSELNKYKFSESAPDKVAHNPISITSNRDFFNQASTENWIGDGSSDNPFQIKDYYIDGNYQNIADENARSPGIKIYNTDVFFIIKNVQVTNSNYGFDLQNVSNAQIINNLAIENFGCGFSFRDTSLDNKNNLLMNNIAIGTLSDNNLSIFEDTIYDEIQEDLLFSFGFRIHAKGLAFSNNSAHENVYGFILSSSSQITIFERLSAINNYAGGIWLGSNIILSNSLASGNGLQNQLYWQGGFNSWHRYGIILHGSGNLLFNNTISENHNGIAIETTDQYGKAPSNNTIKKNLIKQNSAYGVYIRNPSIYPVAENNTIINNDFINNNLGNIQALDEGFNNEFISNYWNDWISPDATNDGIVDYPYLIDGSANNYDLTPLISMNVLVITVITESSNPSFLLFQLIPLEWFVFVTLVTLSGIVTVYFYRKNSSNSFSKQFSALVEDNQITNLRILYHKILIGLDNINHSWLTNFQETEIETLINRDSEDRAIISNIFPPEMQNEIKSQLRGRSILILIELAYLSPDQTHVSQIAQSLSIPQTTVSHEVKRLLELQYIDIIKSKEALIDNRFRYYSITRKGVLFLHILKESLSFSLMKRKITKITKIPI